MFSPLSEYGELARALRAPVEGLRVKAEIEKAQPFTVYTNRSEGSTTAPMGFEPVRNGEPGAAVKLPVVEVTVKAETLPGEAEQAGSEQLLAT